MSEEVELSAIGKATKQAIKDYIQVAKQILKEDEDIHAWGITEVIEVAKMYSNEVCIRNLNKTFLTFIELIEESD